MGTAALRQPSKILLVYIKPGFLVFLLGFGSDWFFQVLDLGIQIIWFSSVRIFSVFSGLGLSVFSGVGSVRALQQYKGASQFAGHVINSFKHLKPSIFGHFRGLNIYLQQPGLIDWAGNKFGKYLFIDL